MAKLVLSPSQVTLSMVLTIEIVLPTPGGHYEMKGGRFPVSVKSDFFSKYPTSLVNFSFERLEHGLNL